MNTAFGCLGASFTQRHTETFSEQTTISATPIFCLAWLPYAWNRHFLRLLQIHKHPHINLRLPSSPELKLLLREGRRLASGSLLSTDLLCMFLSSDRSGDQISPSNNSHLHLVL